MDVAPRNWLSSAVASCGFSVSAIAQALASVEDDIAMAYLAEADKQIKDAQEKLTTARVLLSRK